MKLLIVTQKVSKEDPELGFFHEWLIRFGRLTERLTVVCLEERTHDLARAATILSLGKESGQSKYKYVVRFLTHLWRQRQNYDTVLVHMNPVYVVLGGFFWKLAGKKVALWYTHKQVNLLLRVAVLFADVVLTASPESFRLPTTKLRVMGHGIDTEKFKPTPPQNSESFAILSVGRVSRSKRIDLIIEATRLLIEQGVPANLTVIGEVFDRELEQELKSTIATPSLEGIVRILPGVPHYQLPGLFNRAVVTVNASETGSMDKVVLESMACGIIPIVANEAFAFLASAIDPRLVRDRTARSITDGLAEVYRLGADERAQLGQRCRELIVREHSLDALIPRIIKTLS